MTPNAVRVRLVENADTLTDDPDTASFIELKLAVSYEIFLPNNGSQFKLNSSLINQIEQLEIYDSLGKRVTTNMLGQITSWEANDLPDGSYFVLMSTYDKIRYQQQIAVLR